MKKTFVTIVLTFMVSVTLYSQTCDRYFETKLTYNNEFLNLHYDNLSTGNHYKIFHRTNDVSVNTALSVIDIQKPIIVIEGYDIFYTESCDDIYRHYINYSNLGDYLRANGYDIITYNLSAPMTAIQPNAIVFADFLNFINQNKKGNDELIIMGVSMGGLITRYALTYMEQNNMQHQTKLFLSFDAPQKGGYAPLSMQALLLDPAVNLAGLASPDLAYLISCFKSQGTLQMLTHYAWEIKGGYANPPKHHTYLFNELISLNSCDGYPVNTKRVGISNGSLNGDTQKGLTSTGNYSGNPAIWFKIGIGLIQRGLNTVPGIDNMWEGNCVYRGLEECNLDHGYYMNGNGLPLDHVPGGYYDWYGKLFTELNKISSVTILVHQNDNACFVSTISALDLNTNYLLLNVGSYTKNQILADSHFDDIWWDKSHSNMKHTSYNASLYNFIKDQIFLSESESYAQEYNYISNGSTNSGENQIYKASESLNVENYTVKNGGQLTLKSGNSITLTNGFKVEAGATFSASIENIKSRNCNLAGNLPQFTPSSIKSTIAGENITDTIIDGFNISFLNPESVNIKEISKKEPISMQDVVNLKNQLIIYPNPSNEVVNISFSNSEQQTISIRLIEPVSGKTLKTIYQGIKEKGIFSISLDISDLSSGLYIVMLQGDNYIISEKLIKK